MNSENNNITETRIKFSNKFLVYYDNNQNNQDNQNNQNIQNKLSLLIKSFKPHTLINYVYGKGNKDVKKYSLEHNHRLIGCELKHREDFVSLKRGKVECIFVFFSGTEDTTKINLKKFAKINKIPYYENISDLNEVVLLSSKNSKNSEYSEYSEYSEFDILSEPENNTSVNLIRCLEKIKIRDQECRDFKNNKKILLIKNNNNNNQNNNNQNIYKFFKNK